MTSGRSADERISAWLHGEAPDQLPDRVLTATFDRTRRITQRRTLRGWTILQVRRTTRAVAIGTVAMVLFVVSVALVQRGNLVPGDRPTSTPSGTPTLVPTLDPDATPGPISASGQAAFVLSVDGNIDIYMMNLDRSGLVRLTDDPADDLHPSWSPDGRTLIFTRRQEPAADQSDIYALDIETETETRLTNDPGVEGDAIFSPDGAQIVFDGWPIEPGIYVMDRDGSNRRRLFTPPDDTYVLVGWTDDGTGVHLVRNGVEVLRLDVQDGGVAPVFTGGDENMALSPDGSTFAFQGDGLIPGGIYLMDADGSNVRFLVGSWTKGGPIEWSPDGRHLGFDLDDGWLYVVHADGSGITRWTQGISFAWRPGS